MAISNDNPVVNPGSGGSGNVQIPGLNPETSNFFETLLRTIITLGGLIKGTTQHITYPQAAQFGSQLANTTYASLQTKYTEDQLNRVAVAVVPLFKDAISKQWGTGGVYARDILTTLNNYPGTAPIEGLPPLLYWLLQFGIWTSGNVDATNKAELPAVLTTWYQLIFVQAFVNAGVITTGNAPEVPTPPTPTPIFPTSPTPSAPMFAGLDFASLPKLALIAGVIFVLIALFRR